MKRWIVVALVVCLGAAMLGGTAQSVAQDTATVQVAESDQFGSYFTDAEGRALYLWTVDTQAGASNCYGPCVDFWPLFTTEDSLTLPDGVDGTLTLIERSDGTTQVAYNDIPLYYFAGDTAPGDTNGQYAGDTWYLVEPGAQFGEAAAVALAMQATPVTTTTLLIATDPTLGEYFTDAEGRTVYLFTKDTAIFTSACTDDCLTKWPPVSGEVARVTLPSGGLGELAFMNGNDGTKQLAFNGIPLYYFAGDTEPGQVNGQGAGGVWWVVKPGAQLGQATPTAG